jgi:PAS domain S-box-containing protein
MSAFLSGDSGTVSGGKLDKWFAGIHGFATRRWKIGFGYGNADLDRFDIRDGRTHIDLTRLQWIFSSETFAALDTPERARERIAPGNMSSIPTFSFSPAGSEVSLPRTRLGPDVLWPLAVFELAFLAAYWFAMSFATSAAAPLWFPDSVLLCALLLNPRRRWAQFLLAPLPIRLLVAVVPGTPLWFLLSTYANDSLKALLVATLLWRVLPDPTRFDRVRDFNCFVGAAVLLAPALSAFGGAASRHGLGAPYWQSWLQWFLGDALANLVLTPAILYWGYPRGWWRRVPSRRLAEALLLGLGLIGVGWVAYHPLPGPPYDLLVLFYAPVPFLLWAAIRFGIRGTSGALCVIASFAIQSAAGSRGPFVGGSPQLGMLSLQLFLLLIGVSVLFLAVMVGERDRQAAILRQTEERYREVVNSQTDLVCRFLPDTTLTFVNDAYCRYFGQSRQALIGRKFLELIPEPAREVARLHVESLVREPHLVTDEHEVTRPDGSVGWQQWINHGVVGADGLVAEFQAIGRDISDRKRAEEAGETLALASRLALVGEITASIAHEINQPLGAILSNADAAEMVLDSSSMKPSELRQILEDIRREDLRASEVIRRVRSLLRSHTLEMQEVDVNRLADDVLDMVGTDALRRGVILQRELEPGPAFVRADRVHVQQALLNLVLNGMDAMAETELAKRRLTVATTRKPDGAVEIAVRDAGPGLAPEVLPRLFDSFFTTKPQGMGLGLSLCRSIADAHGGRIVAENNAGLGATFRLCLPRGAEAETTFTRT